MDDLFSSVKYPLMKLRSTLFIIAIEVLFLTAAHAQNINTIIGGLGDGGAATSGKLYNPTGVAVDKWGNIYVADNGSGAVRRVDTNGIITKYYPNTPTAYLGQVSGVAVDTFGNVFIADYNSHKILKVFLSGNTITYAGTGGGGELGDGGPATAAELTPLALSIDKYGNLYVADHNSYSCKIRKIDTSGIITTFAGSSSCGFLGDGFPATTAKLNHPTGVCVDNSGNVFIADNNNNRVRKVDPSGIITTIAGNGIVGYAGDGFPATDANFNKIFSVSVDNAGNVYISDDTNNEIRKVSTSGIVTRVAGAFISGGFSGDGGPATIAQLNNPVGVAFDKSGNFYIADKNNNRIRKVNTSGNISTVVGCNFSAACGFYGDGGPVVSALLNFPTGLAFDTSFNLYIADFQNYVVRKVSNAGIISTVAGNDSSGFSGDNGPAINAKLRSASSVATDRKGNLYICDNVNNRIRKVNSAGIITTYAGIGSSGFSGDGHPADSAKLGSPLSIATDRKGNLYIADKNNARIRKVDTNGIIRTIAGNGTSTYFGDGGPATSAQFSAYGLCLDINGNIFIADASNQRIRKIDTNGIITTVAGGGTGPIGGPAVFAAIGTPQAVHVDKDGNIFISVGNKFYKVNTSGIISNFAGTGTSGFSGDGGPALLAKMSMTSGNSVGMATNSSGDLLITDMGNCRIRKVYNASISISTINDTICSGIGATFTATVITAPIYVPYYHWQRNGLNVGLNSSTYNPTSLSNGDIITCYITDGATGPNIAISNEITVYVPSGSVSVNISASTTVCEGTTVVCTPTPVNGGTSPTYDWYKNGVYIHSGSTYSFIPLNHDTLRCKIKASMPCLVPDSAFSPNKIFTTYSSIPTVTITTSPGTSLCFGTTATITPHPINGGFTPIYNWYKNDTLIYTGSPYSFIPADLDRVYCSMKSNASCVVPDTALSPIVTFTRHYDLPAVNIAASTGASVCQGTGVTINPTPNFGGTAPVYDWYKNGDYVSTGSSYSFIPVSGDTVYCKLTSNASCVFPDTAISNFLSIGIDTPANPRLTVISLQGDTICPGTHVICQAIPTLGGTAPVYSWYKNDTPTIAGALYEFYPLNGDFVYCKLTSNSTCILTDTATSNTITFAYTTQFVPSVSVTVDPGDTICQGSYVTALAAPNNGGSSPAYEWYTNGVHNYKNSNSFHFSPGNGQWIYCTLTNNDCPFAPTTAISDTIQFVVKPVARPSVTFDVDPGTILCNNIPVVCTPTGIAAGASPLFDWYHNGDYVLTADQYSFTPEEGDQVYTRLRSNADCASPNYAISAKKTFHIDSMPSVTLTCSPGQVNFSGTLVTFSANVSSSYGTYHYQWYKNGIAVPDDTIAIYASTTFSIWDSVKCVVTVTGACSGAITSNTLVANTYHSMTLYPDPNYGDFIINGNNHDADGNPVSIRIYNSIGKLVYEKEATFDGITFYTEINLGHKLPPGVYLLRMNYSLDKNVFHFVIK
jgi:trimeric autotransporter adhesin